MAYRRTAAVQERQAATRERILQGTIDLLDEGGWPAVTVASVAARSGIATGTVYRYVDDKDALCVEAFRRAAGREAARVADAAGRPGSAVDRIDEALRVFAVRALRRPRLAAALLMDPCTAAVEAERTVYRGRHRAVLASALADGVAAGELEPHDTALLAAVLVGAMAEALVGPLAIAQRTDGSDAVTDELVAACLRTLPAR